MLLELKRMLKRWWSSTQMPNIRKLYDESMSNSTVTSILVCSRLGHYQPENPTSFSFHVHQMNPSSRWRPELLLFTLESHLGALSIRIPSVGAFFSIVRFLACSFVLCERNPMSCLSKMGDWVRRGCHDGWEKVRGALMRMWSCVAAWKGDLDLDESVLWD